VSEVNVYELQQAHLAERIVSSEPFMWLMQGDGDWTETHLHSLQHLYQAWRELSGGYVHYNGLAGRLAQIERLP
jgi:hypothetical protein